MEVETGTGRTILYKTSNTTQSEECAIGSILHAQSDYKRRCYGNDSDDAESTEMTVG